MRRTLISGIVFVAVAAGFLAAEPAKQLPVAPAVDVLFSPRGGCTDRIVREIGAAKKSVRVQAYSFTSARIAKAILEAKKRGVECQVILDKSQETQQYSELDFFANQGIPTWIDDRHAIAHNKIILLDDETVITGSFNFTKAAEESNAENLLVIKGDADLAAKYRENFGKHLEHSRKYEGRAGGGGGGARAPPASEAEDNEQVSADEADDEIAAEKKPRATPARVAKREVRPRVAAPAKKTPPAQRQTDIVVYVTNTGEKYHVEGCGHLRKSRIPIRLSDAARRYGPCKHCGPPIIPNG